MEQYKVVISGSPVGVIELTGKAKHGDILDFMGRKIFTYYTKGKAIFGRYEVV